MCGCLRAPGETALMLGLQMRKTSNPKHGCVAEQRASVHCHLVGMLTDDTPDSPLLSSPLLFFIGAVRATLERALRRSAENGGKGKQNHGSVIEYVTNTLRIARGNQIKK